MLGEKLVDLMKKTSDDALNNSAELLYGEVTAINPLRVRVDNRFEIDERFIVLSALVKPLTITLPPHDHLVQGQTTSTVNIDAHSHNITGHETANATLSDHSHSIPAGTTGSNGDPTHTHSIPGSSTGNAGGSSHKHNIPAKTTESAGANSHAHTTESVRTSKELTEIVVWRGLIIGDRVRIIKVNRGQLYYIIDREGGVS